MKEVKLNLIGIFCTQPIDDQRITHYILMLEEAAGEKRKLPMLLESLDARSIAFLNPNRGNKRLGTSEDAHRLIDARAEGTD